MVSGVLGLPASARSALTLRVQAVDLPWRREAATDDTEREHDTEHEHGHGYWAVAPGEAARLVAAYRDAAGQAAALAEAFDRAGIGAELVAVTAGLDPAGRPLVRGTVTLAGARRLAELLATGNPPPGLPVAEQPPSWAA